MTSLAVIILTYNEELHIERALTSLAKVASEIFIIDSGSTDSTIDIAHRFGAHVLFNPWVNHAQQFQWGIDHAPITTEWVMRLDADEIIEPDLAAEIVAKLPTLATDITGINLKRKHIFMGRWIRHGGRYPLILLRIWRRDKARIEQRWMDEHMLLTEGQAITFNGGFADINLNDLSFFINKHNAYATREAVDVINQRRGLFPRPPGMTAKNTSAHARLIRIIKEKLYNRLPFELSTALYFLLRYIFQLGFLDGREGAIYHTLQGFWYRFLVGAKIIELERALGNLTGKEAVAKLVELTGLKLHQGDIADSEVNVKHQ